MLNRPTIEQLSQLFSHLIALTSPGISIPLLWLFLSFKGITIPPQKDFNRYFSTQLTNLNKQKGCITEPCQAQSHSIASSDLTKSSDSNYISFTSKNTLNLGFISHLRLRLVESGLTQPCPTGFRPHNCLIRAEKGGSILKRTDKPRLFQP